MRTYAVWETETLQGTGQERSEEKKINSVSYPVLKLLIGELV